MIEMAWNTENWRSQLERLPFFFYIRIVAYANYFHIFDVDQTQCSRQWFAQQAGRQLSQLPF